MKALEIDRNRYVPRHASKIKDIIYAAINDHPRTVAIRCDLRFLDENHDPSYSDAPVYSLRIDRTVISRFFESLKAKINHHQKIKRSQGVRIHRCTLRYVWRREINESRRWHYHTIIFLNKDSFNFLGNYNSSDGNLASMIYSAWASATHSSIEDAIKMVHFPKKPIHTINKNSDTYTFEKDYQDLFTRSLYLAKTKSRYTADGGRSFGTSQN